MLDHPGFMRKKGGGSFHLFWPQFTEKPCLNRLSLLTLIAQSGSNAGVAEKPQ
jgi:hypothetical protein